VPKSMESMAQTMTRIWRMAMTHQRQQQARDWLASDNRTKFESRLHT
jgi:hypothetical protein